MHVSVNADSKQIILLNLKNLPTPSDVACKRYIKTPFMQSTLTASCPHQTCEGMHHANLENTGELTRYVHLHLRDPAMDANDVRTGVTFYWTTRPSFFLAHTLIIVPTAPIENSMTSHASTHAAPRQISAGVSPDRP